MAAAAAAGFGLGYGALRPLVPEMPAFVLGLLYAVNIAGAAPLLGIMGGEQNARRRLV